MATLDQYLVGVATWLHLHPHRNGRRYPRRSKHAQQPHPHTTTSTPLKSGSAGRHGPPALPAYFTTDTWRSSRTSALDGLRTAFLLLATPTDNVGGKHLD